MTGKETFFVFSILPFHHGIGILGEHSLAAVVHGHTGQMSATLFKVVADGFFGQLLDAHLIIYVGHGGNLLLWVVICGIDPVHQFGTLTAVGTVDGIDEHVGLLVAEDVSADGLAEYFRVAINIQIVVLQLECQSHAFAEGIERIGIGLWGIGHDGTNLQGTCQQHTGLEAYHLNVFIFGHISAGLKVDVVLLTLAYLKRGFGKEVEHGAQVSLITLRHALESQHQHAVARKDGCIVVPFLVHGEVAAAHVGTVHQVIVQQGVVVVAIQVATLRQEAFRVYLQDKEDNHQPPHP